MGIFSVVAFAALERMDDYFMLEARSATIGILVIPFFIFPLAFISLKGNQKSTKKRMIICASYYLKGNNYVLIALIISFILCLNRPVLDTLKNNNNER